MLDVYERVKKLGRKGVDHTAWSKGVKVVGAITPLEVVDFQQLWLTPDEETRAMIFGDSSTGGRRRYMYVCGGRSHEKSGLQCDNMSPCLLPVLQEAVR